MVKIRHEGKVGTIYCHMIRRNVHEGQQVRAGDIIGWVGSTGHSGTPHLHFQVHYDPNERFGDNTARDPVAFLRNVGLEFR
jgi:murein DD-endopeptidase MepM/ murein hydrolase activator NlpD